MEWYAMQFCQLTPADASVFGAIQLMALTAVLIFKIPFSKPRKK
jgi:hypothetical protein